MARRDKSLRSGEPELRKSWSSRLLRLTVVLVCSCVAMVGQAAFGQVDQGSINGTVADPSGSAIPGAEVTLTNVDTGLVLKATTNDSGVYTFSPVKIGQYSISATANGFSLTNQTGLQLDVQQHLEVNLQLQLGSVTQRIEVTTAPPVLQTEDASVGQVMSSQAINDTPLNGRNWVFIAQLAAGSVGATGGVSGGEGDFDSNGMRADMNNFILDGVDNNNNVVDFLNGATYVVRPPPDALSEFKLQTSNYSAEFGHSAGAVVNATIKSGTNQIHGDVWEYVRNTALTAKDWEATFVQPYHQNQFGATLGLPIVKNKLFFFGDLEANRIAESEFTNMVVPTALMRTGQFSEINANGVNALTGGPGVPLFQPNTSNPIPNNDLRTLGIGTSPGQLSAVGLNLLSLYPCPGLTTSVAAQLIQSTGGDCGVSRPITDNTFQWDSRMDFNPTSADQMFMRFSYSNERIFRTPPLGMLLDGGNFGDTGFDDFLSQNTVFSETHIFSPTLTNEFRLGYNYAHFSQTQVNANNPNFAQSLGLGGIPNNFPLAGGLPAAFGGGQDPYTDISITPDLPAILFGSPSFMATSEHLNNFQFLDNVTKIKGNHAVKVGVSVLYIRFATLQPPFPRGNYQYTGQFTGNEAAGTAGSGFADFLLNEVGTTNITAVGESDQLRWDYAAFVQDDWKVTKNLTVNLGLRWEDPTSYKDLHGRQANFVPTGPLGIGTGSANYLIPASGGSSPNLGNVFVPLFANPDHVTIVPTSNQYLVSNHWQNFGPRLGVAYQLTNRAAIRAGFGIFYGGLEGVGYGPNIGQNFPFLPTATFFSPTCGGPGSCSPAADNLGQPFALETGFNNILNTPGGVINSISSPGINAVQANTQIPYTEEYNLTAQYSVTNNMAVSLAYVGSESHKLTIPVNINQAQALLPAFSNIGSVRAFPHFGDFTEQEYQGWDSYNSLQAVLEKRFSHGLGFSTNYTFAHSIGIGSGLVGGGGTNSTDSPMIPLRLTAANTSFDARHRFTFNGNYELPFGIGKKFANRSRFEDLAIGGWSASLTFIAQSGLPVTINSTNTSSFSPAAGTGGAPGGPLAVPIGNPFVGGGTPSANGAANTCPTKVRTTQNWYNPCAFENAASGTNIAPGALVTGPAAWPYFGDLQSDQIDGPGFNRVNMSLFKSFKIVEGKNLQFRADVFNLFNHPTWGQPSDTGIGNQGGTITGPLLMGNNTPDARFLQLSAKFLF